MEQRGGQTASRSSVIASAFRVGCGGAALCAFGILALTAERAKALPSFARQTGQPCGTCHTDFPALTPYGRRFKLLGYTVGGSKFRTTPFPSFPSASKASAYASDPALGNLAAYAKAADRPGESQDKGWVPPISMMAIVG